MLMGMNEKKTNEWPQNNMIINDHSSNKTMASSSTTTTTIDHNHNNHLQQQNQQLNQQSLKCPRCDSSNTKFCYYNNYSLSQPRHFCKACKRYWTRGGTLRNVPVGGGCRKNKRVKRSSAGASTSDAHVAPITPPPQATTTTPNNIFYGHDLGLPSFSRYDHLSSLGLGFNGDENANNSNYLSSYGSIFGSSSSSSPTIASLLASKFNNNGGTGRLGLGSNSFHGLAPFEELNIGGNSINNNNSNNGVGFMGLMNSNNGDNSNKQVKLELDGQGVLRSSSTMGWINGGGGGNNSATNNPTDQIGLSTSSDPSIYWSNINNPTAVGLGGGNWLDPMANIVGSNNNSVPSLI